MSVPSALFSGLALAGLVYAVVRREAQQGLDHAAARDVAASTERESSVTWSLKEREMDDFKVGDVVVLKSGGPLMTIHNIRDVSPNDPNPGLSCIWFDNFKKVEDVFDARAVEHYRD
jgi:uncharacterized protein YodC (DUF2158 family)